jgi:hypothetical protein
MVDQSQFSKLPKKQIVIICEQLMNGNFYYENPYYSSYYDSVDELEKIAKYFGIPVLDEDVQFFAKLIQTNKELLTKIFETKDKSLYNQLVIPVAKEYDVNYHTRGTCTFREEYETTWTSYDKDWVIESMEQMRSDSNWDLYEGRHIETDYDNHETDDWGFDSVKLYRNDIEESKIKNTIIESLDKKTLLELRGLIDNKLRSL